MSKTVKENGIQKIRNYTSHLKTPLKNVTLENKEVYGRIRKITANEMNK